MLQNAVLREQTLPGLIIVFVARKQMSVGEKKIWVNLTFLNCFTAVGWEMCSDVREYTTGKWACITPTEHLLYISYNPVVFVVCN